MQPRTFYDILEISRTASTEEVRKAYRRKALVTHPDKLDQGATEFARRRAENQFNKIREAFDVLGDPLKRQQYDTFLGSSKPNTFSWSEQLQNFLREREEWAKKQEERHLARIAILKEQLGVQHLPRREEREIPEEVREIVDAINMAIDEARPGWLERLRKAQQFKAEQEARQRGQRVNV